MLVAIHLLLFKPFKCYLHIAPYLRCVSFWSFAVWYPHPFEGVDNEVELSASPESFTPLGLWDAQCRGVP